MPSPNEMCNIAQAWPRVDHAGLVDATTDKLGLLTCRLVEYFTSLPGQLPV